MTTNEMGGENPQNTELMRLVASEVDRVRQYLTKEEAEAINGILDERTSKLSEDEKKVLAEALRLRVKQSRENFLEELKNLLLQAEYISEDNLMVISKTKMEEYQSSLINLIVNIYSEFHISDDGEEWKETVG